MDAHSPVNGTMINQSDLSSINESDQNFSTDYEWDMWMKMYEKNKDNVSGSTLLNVCVTATIAFVGIVANLIVVFVTLFGNTKQKESSSITYVTNLSISNFVFLLTVPFRLVEDVYIGWTLGEAFCQIVTLIKHLNFSVVALFLMVMSIDRYLAVNKPLAASNLRSHRAAVYASLSVWSVSLAGALPLALWHTAKEGLRCVPHFPDQPWMNVTDIIVSAGNQTEGSHLVCSYHAQSTGFAAWTICNFFYSFLIPFLVIICCYCAIVQRVRHPSAIVNAKGKMHRGIKRKVTQMAVILVISYTICYMPYYVWQIARLIGVPVNHVTVCAHVQKFNSIMAYVNSALHPIVYACTSGQFSLQYMQAKRKLACAGNSRRYNTGSTHARTGTGMTSLTGSKDIELTRSPRASQKMNGSKENSDEKERCLSAMSAET